MVSVCIATYNGATYIREQLASILPQIGEDDEVVISDDGSTDDTLLLIQAFRDPRIRILTHIPLEKVRFTIDRSTRNFIHAMEHARGDIIFLSDQDDVWLPTKVEKMLRALQQYDLVKTDCSVTDANLNIVTPSYCARRPFSTSILKNLISGTFTGSCMAFRRQVFEAAQPFPPSGVAHDLWLGLVALKNFRVGFVDEPLMLYRRHESTVTSSATGQKTPLLFKLHYRYHVGKALLKLYLRPILKK